MDKRGFMINSQIHIPTVEHPVPVRAARAHGPHLLSLRLSVEYI